MRKSKHVAFQCHWQSNCLLFHGLGVLPIVAALVVALNGSPMLLVAFGNISDFGAMPSTTLDDDMMWRAITNETLQNIPYAGIFRWELATAGVLLAAAVSWIGERDGGYRLARALSAYGLVMALLLFVGGFIVIGGEWFQMWRSASWNGLEPAFRNSVLAMLGLVLIHLPSSGWNQEDTQRADRTA